MSVLLVSPRSDSDSRLRARSFSSLDPPLTPVAAPMKDMDDDFDDQRTKWRLPRYLLYTIGCMLTVCFSGGLILGYGPFYSAMVRDEQWHELCSGPDVCHEQEQKLKNLFTTGYMMLSLCNAIFGLTLDIVGPRWTVLMAFLIAIIGNICVAFGDSTESDGFALVLGFSMIGGGGIGISLSTLQFSNLFSQPAFPCSIICGLFNVSAFVYSLIQPLNASTHDFFLAYACFAMAGFWLVFFFYPVRSIAAPEKHPKVAGCSLSCSAAYTKPNGLFSQLKPQLTRIEFWLFFFMFGWISLINAFTTGALPDILRQRGGPDHKYLELFTNYLFPYMSNSAFVFSPFVGIAIHKWGFIPVMVLCIVVAQLYVACLFIDNLYAQLGSFILLSLEQALIYTLQFSYIMLEFPKEVYGSLQTVLTIGSFFFSSISYSLNPLDQSLALWILLGPTVLLYALPLFLFCKKKNLSPEDTHLIT